MQPSVCGVRTRELDGTVTQVDTVNREMQVLVNGASQTVYVPPDCMVLLRGEPVKLRIMQPRDRVRLRVLQRSGSLVAQLVEVRNEGWPAAS